MVHIAGDTTTSDMASKEEAWSIFSEVLEVIKSETKVTTYIFSSFIYFCLSFLYYKPVF